MVLHCYTCYSPLFSSAACIVMNTACLARAHCYFCIRSYTLVAHNILLGCITCRGNLSQAVIFHVMRALDDYEVYYSTLPSSISLSCYTKSFHDNMHCYYMLNAVRVS